MAGDPTLPALLESLIAEDRARPREGADPPWLKDLALTAHPDFLTLYRTLAPGPIGSAGARLLAPAERLTRLKPDWRVAAKSEFLGCIENPHGGLVAWWLREGGWVLVELYPGSIHPRDLSRLGLAGWLREELEGESVREVDLGPVWGHMTRIMLIVGVIGLVLTTILVFWFAGEAEAQRW